MAAAKSKSTTASNQFLAKPRRKRPGQHSKKKNCKNKRSKNYKKVYNSQGR